jgi:hypothetical protein
VLFSVKESVYKAWYPFARRPLRFGEALVDLGPDPDACGVAVTGTLGVRLLVPGLVLADGALCALAGRYAVRAGLVLTAVWVRGRRRTSPEELAVSAWASLTFAPPLVRDADRLSHGVGLLAHVEHEMGQVGGGHGEAALEVLS